MNIGPGTVIYYNVMYDGAMTHCLAEQDTDGVWHDASSGGSWDSLLKIPEEWVRTALVVHNPNGDTSIERCRRTTDAYKAALHSETAHHLAIREEWRTAIDAFDTRDEDPTQ